MPDEGFCRVLNDESTPAETRKEFQDAVSEIGPASKDLIDADLKTEDEFFSLVKSVESKIPKRRHSDPAFMRMKLDVFGDSDAQAQGRYDCKTRGVWSRPRGEVIATLMRWTIMLLNPKMMSSREESG